MTVPLSLVTGAAWPGGGTQRGVEGSPAPTPAAPLGWWQPAGQRAQLGHSWARGWEDGPQTPRMRLQGRGLSCSGSQTPVKPLSESCRQMGPAMASGLAGGSPFFSPAPLTAPGSVWLLFRWGGGRGPGGATWEVI